MEKKKVNVKNGIIILLVAAVICFFYLQGSDSPLHTFRDYASAGDYVKPQIMKIKDTLSVTVITDEYNDIIGAEPILNHVLKAAYAYTGDPEEGDILAMQTRPKEVISTKKDKSDGTDKLTMNVKTEYYVTKEQKEALRAAAETCLAGLRIENASDYEKIRAIYDYVCANVTYDDTHLEDDAYTLKYTAYAAAVDHTAVCAGIAGYIYTLGNMAGLEVRIKTNSNHAWNFVKLGEKVYYLDATWDLGKTPEEYEYFLKGNLDFNHRNDFMLGPFFGSDFLGLTDLDYTVAGTAYDPYGTAA